MTLNTDIFRPGHDPARLLYDAFQGEAQLRRGRDVDEWMAAERRAVWATARDYAQQQGLPIPSLAQVELKEQVAVGHTDFGAKWAYGVAELLKP